MYRIQRNTVTVEQFKVVREDDPLRVASEATNSEYILCKEDSMQYIMHIIP